MKYKAVLFDLLTALVDSWTLWGAVAGSPAHSRRWRAAYLRLTYACGDYRPYEALIAEAATEVGLAEECAVALAARWGELQPWPEAPHVLAAIGCGRALGVVTNCSATLGARAADCVGVPFATVITAEAAGAYKPDPRPYRRAIDALGLTAEEVLFVAGSSTISLVPQCLVRQRSGTTASARSCPKVRRPRLQCGTRSIRCRAFSRSEVTSRAMPTWQSRVASRFGTASSAPSADGGS
jgi:2-haloacid dehalogenase